MKNIQKVILILIIEFILIIGIILILLNHGINNITEYQGNTNESNLIKYEQSLGDEDVKIEYIYGPISNPVRFFTVKKCIEEYRKGILAKDYNYIYNILDKSYIDANNITIKNIENHIESYSEDEEILIIDIYELPGELINQYSVEYYAINKEDNSARKRNIIIVIDAINLTYSIIHIDNDSSIDNIQLVERNNHIEKNEYNTFQYQRLGEESIIRFYYDTYNKMLLYVPEKAYQYLDKEYKEKRFNNSYQEFIKYIEENKINISNTIVTKYSINGKQYELINNINNAYILDINTLLDFKVKLDNYTIKAEDFREYSDQKKINFYINQIINMVNYKEYNNLYLLLNDVFKKNNFSDIEKFKEIIEQNFYDINYIIERNIDMKEQYYVVNIKIADKISNSANKKNVNFIIKLLDDNNFEMSFSFN